MMNTQKKYWETPQLVILARGTPEESVLLSCKAIAATAGPGTSVQNSCASLDDTTKNCSNCQSRGGGAS